MYMVSLDCRLSKRLCFIIVLALALLTPLTNAADERPSSEANSDPVLQGFVDLVANLNDISTTIIQVPAEGSDSLPLSGRVMYSRSVNMLSFSIVNHAILEGLTLILDNNDNAVYLISPSSDEAFKIPAEVAAAQLTGIGISPQHSGSIMAAFEQMLPISVLSNFNLEPMGYAENEGKQYFLLKATPKDCGTDPADRWYDYAVLWIDPTTYHLCRLEQFTNGQESLGAFLLADSSYNSGLTESDFMIPLQGKSIVSW